MGQQWVGKLGMESLGQETQEECLNLGDSGDSYLEENIFFFIVFKALNKKHMNCCVCVCVRVCLSLCTWHICV